MLKINNLDKLKFTKISKNMQLIHFKYDDKHYFLRNGYNALGDYTPIIELYEGRSKYNLKPLSRNYGMSLKLIKYIGNKKVLKYIDKENFVNKLINKNILER